MKGLSSDIPSHYQKGPNNLALRALVREAELAGAHKTRTPLGTSDPYYLFPKGPRTPLTIAGAHMETTVQIVNAATETLEQSKNTMQELGTLVGQMATDIGPKLHQQVLEMRSARMAVVSELSALREVRAFFSEPDHEAEMQRLERFVSLCRELQALKAEGVFDAVIESSLSLLMSRDGKAKAE